jgi:hypothetical protein
MKRIYAALAIAATLLVAGCLPVTSKTPVGTTAGLGADQALYGTWVGHSQDEKEKGVAYFHFLKGKDNEAGAISALMVTPGDNDDDWMSFTVRTAKLGAHNYMNAVATGGNGAKIGAGEKAEEKGGSIPLLYSFGKHHTLTLYMLDEDKVKAAIQAGKIAGTIESGDYGEVTITADAAALDAFFATPEAAKLFKVFIALKKAE